MSEELYARVMLELARKEGHKPMHKVTALVPQPQKRAGTGTMAAKVRALYAEGLTLKETCQRLGISTATGRHHAKTLGIVFPDQKAAA